MFRSCRMSVAANSVRRTFCSCCTGRTKKRMYVTAVIARNRTPAHRTRLTRYASTVGCTVPAASRFCNRLAEVVPAAEFDGLSAVQEFHSLAFFTAPDLVETTRFGDGGEELVVLAETDVLKPGAGRERHAVEVDDEAAARARGDVARVDGDAVGNVEHRGRVRSELAALVEPERRPDIALRAKGGASCAERPRHDEPVAGARAAAAWDTFRAAEGGDGQRHALRSGRIAADDGHLRLRDPLVELEHVLDGRQRRHCEADDEGGGRGSGRREVAEVDRGRAPAKIAPGDPAEPEVDVLDERVLRHDEAAFELGGVVLDPAREPAALELGDETQLPELRQLHRRSAPNTPQGGSEAP